MALQRASFAAYELILDDEASNVLWFAFLCVKMAGWKNHLIVLYSIYSCFRLSRAS